MGASLIRVSRRRRRTTCRPQAGCVCAQPGPSCIAMVSVVSIGGSVLTVTFDGAVDEGDFFNNVFVTSPNEFGNVGIMQNGANALDVEFGDDPAAEDSVRYLGSASGVCQAPSLAIT